MDEPIDEPTPPPRLPDEVVEAIASLPAPQLRQLVEYAQSRLQFMEMSISDLIEPEEDEEIVRIEDYGYYTVVVKRQKDSEGDEESEKPPQIFVVTLEPEREGGHHLHWENIGRLVE